MDVEVDGQPVFSGACPAVGSAQAERLADADLDFPCVANLLEATCTAAVAWDRAVCGTAVSIFIKLGPKFDANDDK